jgi:hypothetical protein
MATIAGLLTSKTVGMMTAPEGLNAAIGELRQDANLAISLISGSQIFSKNVAIELAERSVAIQYPTLHVYCEKLSNLLTEKFRTFSGRGEMTIEVRVSDDRLDDVDGKLRTYVDAVTQVLDRNRGDWENGLFYTGGYEVSFGPVKQGGRHFIQIAKITFEVQVSA